MNFVGDLERVVSYGSFGSPSPSTAEPLQEPAALAAARLRAVDWFDKVLRRPPLGRALKVEGPGLDHRLAQSGREGLKLYAFQAALQRGELSNDSLVRTLAAVQRLVQVEGFNNRRGLLEAASELGPLFAIAVNRLGPDDVWLDIGAGRAVMQREVAEQCGACSPQMIAVACHAPEVGFEERWAREMPAPARGRYLAGRAFEDIAVSELPLATLASDVYGACTYGPKFDVALRRAAEAVAPGGLLCVATFSGNVFVDLRGDTVAPCTYASAIEGLELLHWGAEAHSMSFAWLRTDAPVRVPRLGLAWIDAFDGMPRQRVHRVLETL